MRASLLPGTRLYKADFGSCACEVVMPDAPPPDGENPLGEVKWIGQFHPDLLMKYIAWANGVLEDCAKRWNKRLFYAYSRDSKKNSFLAFVFEPGKPAKRIEKQ